MEEGHNVTSLIGKHVCLYENGIALRAGLLLAVKPDHLVLHEESEGIVYYKRERVTSISAAASNISQSEGQQGDQLPAYIDVSSMDALLETMQSYHVSINHEGHVGVEGVLTEVFPNRLVLSHDDELTIFFKAHLHSIRVIERKEEQIPQRDAVKDSIWLGRWEWPYENFRWWLRRRKAT